MLFRSAASADSTVRITPPRRLSLEESLEFIRGDECVEVTPRNVRIRKLILDSNAREKASKRGRPGTVGAVGAEA